MLLTQHILGPRATNKLKRGICLCGKLISSGAKHIWECSRESQESCLRAGKHQEMMGTERRIGNSRGCCGLPSHLCSLWCLKGPCAPQISLVNETGAESTSQGGPGWPGASLPRLERQQQHPARWLLAQPVCTGERGPREAPC